MTDSPKDEPTPATGAELAERYRLEREKRLRPDGRAQYRDMAGAAEHFARDPNADATFEREPRKMAIDVAIIGGGFGGILTAAALRKAGVADLLIFEKGADFGGTWYWNRYPGAACDVESYIYMPLLQDTAELPAEKYAKGPDILRHCQNLARRHELYERALLQTVVTQIRWSSSQARWLISTDRNDLVEARFVVTAGGLLHRAKLPGIPGIETFAGHSFHTSRWDYAYTGGNHLGGLDGLKDKVVGIIGTGATAVQCVPHLAAGAKRLYVFQRTPSAILPRNNRSTDPAGRRASQPAGKGRG